MASTVLVTGGAGFIGSHCCVDLLDHGFDVVVVDSLVNSSVVSLDRVRSITGRDVSFSAVDVNDRDALGVVLGAHAIDAVVHFAAHKAVGDSVDRPYEYYRNNVGGLLSLIGAVLDAGIRQVIFSSSCSIYGDTSELPITEDATPRPTNPYAASKLMCERILRDLCASFTDLAVTALRYFNPIGAHQSGVLGEDPRGIPNNVVPYLAQVAMGRLDELRIFGSDYPTVDGTGVRDYIHVVDVVEGHRLALADAPTPGFHRYNLGTGYGTSVLELVTAFSEACGRRLPYSIVDRRPGDVAALVASSALAEVELGWRARRSLAEMCADAWRFQQQNPFGYGKTSSRIAARA